VVALITCLVQRDGTAIARQRLPCAFPYKQTGKHWIVYRHRLVPSSFDGYIINRRKSLSELIGRGMKPTALVELKKQRGTVDAQ
jgi:hypothetical protein